MEFSIPAVFLPMVDEYIHTLYDRMPDSTHDEAEAFRDVLEDAYAWIQGDVPSSELVKDFEQA